MNISFMHTNSSGTVQQYNCLDYIYGGDISINQKIVVDLSDFDIKLNEKYYLKVGQSYAENGQIYFVSMEKNGIVVEADNMPVSVLNNKDIYVELFYRDLTPPSKIASVRDGLKSDVNWINTKSQISANWDPSSDNETDIVKYYYTVGTSSGNSDVLDWVDNGKNCFVTYKGLNLEENKKYFVSVKAENSSGICSSITSSNGQTVDLTPPKASIKVSTFTTNGNYSVQLFVLESNDISGIPVLRYSVSSSSQNYQNDLLLEGKDKEWKGLFNVGISTEDVAIDFSFNCEDSAGNKGTEIVSGKSFKILKNVDNIDDDTCDNNNETSNDNFTSYIGCFFKSIDGTIVDIPKGAIKAQFYLSVSMPDMSSINEIESDYFFKRDKTYRKITSTNLYRNFKVFNKADNSQITKFEKPVRISIPYPDYNNDGILDGTNIKIETLMLFYLDKNLKQWVPLKSKIDYQTSSITAETDHFSIFGIMQFKAMSDFSEICVYPNPCNINKTPYVFISNIPIEAKNLEVQIYTITGELVKILKNENDYEFYSGYKSIKWDGTNNDFQKAASGIYIYILKSDNFIMKGKVALVQ